MEIRVDLEWSKEADQALFEIYNYYKDKNLQKGLYYIDQIEEQAEDIMYHPNIGMKSKKKDLRKLYIANTPYFLVYKLLPNKTYPETAYIATIISAKNVPVAKHY